MSTSVESICSQVLIRLFFIQTLRVQMAEAVVGNRITREEVITEARTWIGTPFQHQGFHKGRGTDCLGLVRTISTSLNLSDYREDDPWAAPFKPYKRSPNSHQMRLVLTHYLVSIPVESALPADIYWMVWHNEPQHLAIVSDVGIIHAHSQVGKVVEHSINDEWRNRIVESFRFPILQEA